MEGIKLLAGSGTVVSVSAATSSGALGWFSLGSPQAVAGVCSSDGRHLAMMPHPERCIYPHNWAWYGNEKSSHDVTPWIEMFVNAREWVEKHL